MSDFRFYEHPGYRPTGSTGTTRPNGGITTGAGLVDQAKADAAAKQTATSVQAPGTGVYGQAAAYGNASTAGGVVSMPNTAWYYSAADAYGINGQNPADPRSGIALGRDENGVMQYQPIWNWGVDSKAAGEDLFDEAAGITPYQKAIMREYAKSIHPSGTESGVWEDAVAASMSLSQRGIFKTPLSIVNEWLLEWQDAGGGPGGSSGGGGGFGGGFGGGGGGGPQINLMNENDARAVVNSLASAMIGRTVSEKEFQGYYSDILKLQKENPTTVEFGDDGTQTVNQSIGAEGIRYNLEEQMRNTEDFVTTSIGTQGLDMLEAYIAKRSL